MFKHLILILFALQTRLVLTQLVDEECVRAYDNAPGRCRRARECKKVRDDYNAGIKITYCSYLSNEAVVCCPESSESRPTRGSRISAQKCKEYEELTYESFNVWGLLLDDRTQPSIKVPKCNPVTPLIVGGNPAGKGEFPHMAAIGWRRSFGEVSFDCGGSLISDRFVLTAAHCRRSGNAEPSFVRLGDHNINSRNDGVDEVDIDIERFIPHPEYNSRTTKNDIALIELVQPIRFSHSIRPACLWQNPSVNVTKAVASGWGYTGYASPQSDELLKVELDIINKNECNVRLQEKLALTRDKLTDGTQICAGKLEGGKDTCNGDSGGPLQVTLPGNSCLYYVIALTSFGGVYCGFPDQPAVYTRVSAYLDFIEQYAWN